MKTIITIIIMMSSFFCSAQMRLGNDNAMKAITLEHETAAIDLHIKKKYGDNGARRTASILYFGFNTIITLNQYTSPPNVRRDLQPAYIGGLVLSTVAYTIFMITAHE